MIPGEHLGWPALVVAVIGLMFVAASLLSLLRVRRTQPGELRDAVFLVFLAITFGLQFVFGLLLIDHPESASDAHNIAILVIVCFFIGIARAWELVGGPSIGLVSEIRATVRERGAGSDGPTDARG